MGWGGGLEDGGGREREKGVKRERKEKDMGSEHRQKDGMGARVCARERAHSCV